MSFISALAAQVAPQLKTAATAVDTAAKTIAMSAQETAKRARIKETAQNFESSFLSVMMQQMSDGVKAEAPFSGGQGEEAFKSMLSEAMAKNITKSGGIGLAPTIQREMLKMQGLKE